MSMIRRVMSSTGGLICSTALQSDPMTCADELDWVAKLQVLDGYRRRDGVDWDDARLQLVDLRYSDMTAGKGLARRLEARGSLKRITTDEQIAAAVSDAPHDTRAWFRGSACAVTQSRWRRPHGTRWSLMSKVEVHFSEFRRWIRLEEQRFMWVTCWIGV